MFKGRDIWVYPKKNIWLASGQVSFPRTTFMKEFGHKVVLGKRLSHDNFLGCFLISYEWNTVDGRNPAPPGMYPKPM